MTDHEIRIDRSKTLAQEPGTGHNRWHPDIPPVARVAPGDLVTIPTRDAFDGQFTSSSTAEDVGKVDLMPVHPLTGPVYVEGAEPGDLLEVELAGMDPEPFAFTVQVPGFGFLRDVFPEPYIVRWEIADGYATSEDLPNVRVPGNPFPGVIGVSPNREDMERMAARERDLADRGGAVLLPDPAGAVPAHEPIASEALRTIPPRENAGNVDVKQLTKGTKVLIPVSAEGALFSVGDAHFAQGDGEICGTAVEMSATMHVRFDLRKGQARDRGITDLQYACEDYFLPPELAVPRRCFVTTGMSITKEGRNESEDATLAARNAMLNMIEHLGAEYGYTRQQAYAICSVAVDLRINQMVDVPNFIVSALLPLDVITA
jgi:formamidase